jgi:predicted amidohydrolase
MKFSSDSDNGSDSLIIASAQIDLIENDHAGNMEKVGAMTDRIAAESEADVILYPELCIEGNDFSGYVGWPGYLLAEIDGFWSDLARKYKKYLVTGRVRQKNETLFDSAVCYAPDGGILKEYDKAHLYEGEREVFSAGGGFTVAKIGSFNMGLLICADVGFPEFTRKIARNGADAFIIVSSWCRPYEDLWLLCCRARAAENCCWLISCNRLGIEPSGRENCGYSVAVSPSGEIVCDLAESQNAFFTVEINKKEIEGRRREIKWLEQLRPELYR